MCEAGDREQKACTQLIEEIKKNGKCSSHEELTTKLSWVQGGMAVLLTVLLLSGVGSWMVYSSVSANTAIIERIDSNVDKIGLRVEVHMNKPAHPVATQRMSEIERRIAILEGNAGE